jgi:hypothetical protein
MSPLALLTIVVHQNQLYDTSISSFAPSIIMPAKRITWGNMIIYEFQLGHNGCAVPSTGGPAIGLVGSALSARTISVQDRLSTPRAHEELYLAPMLRVEVLRDLNFSINEIALFCIATNQSRRARHETEQEYILEMRQRQHEAHVAKEQMAKIQRQRQQQLYLQMQQQRKMSNSRQYESCLNTHQMSSFELQRQQHMYRQMQEQRQISHARQYESCLTTHAMAKIELQRQMHKYLQQRQMSNSRHGVIRSCSFDTPQVQYDFSIHHGMQIMSNKRRRL